MKSGSQYTNEYILHFGHQKDNGESSDLLSVAASLRQKWLLNHSNDPCELVDGHSRHLPGLLADGNTRLYVVIHGAPGGKLNDDKNVSVTVEQLADKLISIIGDANVAINLVICSGSKGSAQHIHTSADSTGALLQQKIYEKTKKKIVVTAREHVTFVSIEGKKAVASLDISLKTFNRMEERMQQSAKRMKQPGSKAEFYTSETGEQFKRDAYSSQWKTKFLKHLEKLKTNPQYSNISQELTQWSQEITDKNNTEIRSFIQDEYENPNSILNQIPMFNRAVIPHFIRLQQILKSKHAYSNNLKVRNADGTIAQPEARHNENVQFYLPPGLRTYKEIILFGDEAVIKAILNLQPRILSISDFFDASQKKLIKFEEWWLAYPNKENILRDLSDTKFVRRNTSDIEKLLIMIPSNAYHKFLQSDKAYKIIKLLEQVHSPPHEFEMKILSKINECNIKYNAHDLKNILAVSNIPTLKAINEKYFRIETPLEKKEDYEQFIAEVGGDKNCLLVLLQHFKHERSSDERSYLSFWGKSFGIEKDHKLAAAAVLTKALTQALATDKNTLEIDLNLNRLERSYGIIEPEQIKRALNDGRLGLIFAAIQKQFPATNITYIYSQEPSNNNSLFK